LMMIRSAKISICSHQIIYRIDLTYRSHHCSFLHTCNSSSPLPLHICSLILPVCPSLGRSC
jgi:hypothetical protein